MLLSSFAFTRLYFHLYCEAVTDTIEVQAVDSIADRHSHHEIMRIRILDMGEKIDPVSNCDSWDKQFYSRSVNTPQYLSTCYIQAIEPCVSPAISCAKVLQVRTLKQGPRICHSVGGVGHQQEGSNQHCCGTILNLTTHRASHFLDSARPCVSCCGHLCAGHDVTWLTKYIP